MLLVAVLFAACAPVPAAAPAPSEEAAAEPTSAPVEEAEEVVTIEFWDFQQSDKDILEAQEKAIAEFKKENPNIDINVTVFPIAEYRDKLLVATQGGQPPDISTLDQIWVAEWAASGAIIPLDDYIASSGISRDIFFPGAWDSNVWQGKTWGIPLNNDVWQELYYNKDMFEAAGLDPERGPADWDEWLEYCEKLNNPPEQYCISFMGTGEYVAVIGNSFIHSNGGAVLSEDGTEALINQPKAVEGLEMWKALEAYAPPLARPAAWKPMGSASSRRAQPPWYWWAPGSRTPSMASPT